MWSCLWQNIIDTSHYKDTGFAKERQFDMIESEKIF
jgi:hypothetical protein